MATSTKIPEHFVDEVAPEGGRIDTHHHFLPKVYLDAVGRHSIAGLMPNGAVPECSVERNLELLEKYKIGKAILSISSGSQMNDRDKIQALARECNEYAATLKSGYPGQFGSFASLPRPDVPATLREIEYALDTLHADGFIVFTNYAGCYLGHPVFNEVWQELNRRKATVFIHPDRPPYKLPDGPAESVLEYPFETTRAAVSLIYSGATQRYTDIKFILSHAGGTLPFLSARVVGGVMMNPELRERVPDAEAELRRFYYDTALSTSDSAMSSLMQLAADGHMLFGTDLPYAPEVVVPTSIMALNRIDMSEGLLAGIYRNNALALVGK